MKLLKFVIPMLLVVGVMCATVACKSDADVASSNISKDADNFKILRRVVFYNGITGDYVLEIEGYCSVDPESDSKLSVTCKVGDGQYKKHYLGRSDNVTWFAEQIEAANVSTKHYKVVFKPSTIIPQPEVR